MRTVPPIALRSLLLAGLLTACGDDPADPKDTGGGTDTTTATSPDGSDTNVGPDGNTNNAAPELERIGDRVVAIGKTLVITLAAKDADNDELTYSVFGNLPAGARFDKDAHRFEWSPTEAGKTVFLTFVASDGTDFDRETVRIQTTADATSNPPSFVELGDQIVTPGASVALTLVATDPDGDAITYGFQGTLPQGATLNPETGAFAWSVPGDITAGAPVRVTFTATDGTASDSLVVNFIIDDGSGTVPKPPVFEEVGNVTAKVGEQVSITLVATDPNGDAITYSIKSGGPAGGSLDGATFTWTPSAAEVGQTFTITFAATDGTFTALAETKITVTSGQVGNCTADAEEPNEDIAGAKPLAIGTKNATLCETEATLDTDVWAVDVPGGQELTVTLTFTAPEADIDIFLYSAAGDELAASDGVSNTETFRYAPAAAGTYYIVVLGYALEPLTATYTLTTALAAPTSCTDDDYEDNDLQGAATPYDAQVEAASLQICGGDADYYRFAVQCGSQVDIIMDIASAGADLDLYLYNDTSSPEPIDAAITEDPIEGIEIAAAPNGGTWVLEVSGYPFNTAESGYELLIEVGDGCVDDDRGNNTRDDAASFSGLASGVVCCGDDWFELPLAAGEKATVDVGSDNDLAVGVIAFAPDGTTQVGAREQSTNFGSFAFTAAAAGTYYLKVTGAVSAEYLIDVAVTTGSEQCDDMTCGLYTVCDTSSGQCVSDFCFGDFDCPVGYDCEETYCTNGCEGEDDCRGDEGYSCKQGTEVDYCGISGAGGHGESCGDHSECAGQQVCLFFEPSGYCAEAGCESCPANTKCATFNGQQFCAKTCNVASDCRVSDGYTCSAEKTCLPTP